ncbi:uncharacterized protein BDZ99DRAFT_100007 [Mytilinidion resinicola]|uniref:Uncharacterized protein n=1 Tax=Mytilinidion resinicola TaxID=574789 RepID=A0A6A6YBI7_9PEZI|nr:uncharacterized protein BDZ99DRAFT_100007 [Mytilinidion resinicola]KAF2805873.1 hypothetical protein BDZ99DRAFT_100007 [Mytilinidion resinicola]
MRAFSLKRHFHPASLQPNAALHTPRFGLPHPATRRARFLTPPTSPLTRHLTIVGALTLRQLHPSTQHLGGEDGRKGRGDRGLHASPIPVPSYAVWAGGVSTHHTNPPPLPPCARSLTPPSHVARFAVAATRTPLNNNLTLLGPRGS